MLPSGRRAVRPLPASKPPVSKPKKTKGLAPASTLLTKNRRATHEYEVLERHEAGIVLSGSEVKSIRAGRVSLAEAYAAFVGDELYLMQAHVSEYEQAHARNHEPVRRRKLLMHRQELNKLAEAVEKQGLTLVPLSLYLKDGRVKVELALVRGKQMHDKRASIKEREQKREMSRALSQRE